MPELSEQMYCHQQICIPPTFPYLLRQYAKAAIRSQPIDLLKWSTAYFRCLSLNIPPPVKPRLEYPIPRDYVGITPGWLRALNYQLQNNITVPFKILWDRWIGSCLQHETLIKILCLGGFTDNLAIPWQRFIGLCAGFLTDNLTQTMIMVCEILTEEPEGGSAMIPLETFLDVYKFLANIDASKPQTLLNLYFTDSALNLYEKEKKRAARAAIIEDVGSIESSTPTPEEVLEEEEPEIAELGEGSIVSCPDIVSDDQLQEPDIVEREKSQDSVRQVKEAEEDDEEEDYELKQTSEHPSAEIEEKVEELPPQEDDSVMEDKKSGEEEPPVEESAVEVSVADEGQTEETIEKEGKREYEDEERKDDQKEDEEEHKEEPERGEDDEEEKEEGKEVEKEKSEEDELKQVERDILEKGGLEFDELQECLEEEEDENMKVYSMLKETMPEMRMQEIPGEGGFYHEMDELEQHIKVKYQDTGTDRELASEEVGEEEEPAEEVEVEPIPGIGPIVPPELVEAVERYLTEVAAEEHGMTMPRHVRHYNCPPLEIYE